MRIKEVITSKKNFFSVKKILRVSTLGNRKCIENGMEIVGSDVRI